MAHRQPFPVCLVNNRCVEIETKWLSNEVYIVHTVLELLKAEKKLQMMWQLGTHLCLHTDVVCFDFIFVPAAESWNRLDAQN